MDKKLRHRHPGRARRAGAQPVQRAFRGAVPHLELRLRERRAGRRALRRRRGGMVYSRYTNPTVGMFQDRLAALEGGEACVATASGMAAILATAMVAPEGRRPRGLLATPCSARPCSSFSTLLGRFGVETTLVSPTRVEEWQRRDAGRNTRLLFLETPSNPLIEISDIPALVGGGEEGGRAARRRQRLLHAGAAAAARAGRRHRGAFGDQVHRRAGPGARRRGGRLARPWSASRCTVSCAPPARRSRRSTPGCS